MIMEFEPKDILQLVAILGVISAVVYGIIHFFHDLFQRRSKEREAFLHSFDTLVSQLTSDNNTAQLSAAILLRRYFKKTKKKRHVDLRVETINVISSLLKIIPTGVFQKTLADGFAYAINLSQCDLQKTNLQDVYLGNKDHQIIMNQTDLFLADLSYALLENIIGHNIVFYKSVLLCTQIKNCDFTGANFVGADLTNTTFKNVILKDANFSGALNIPEEISKKLVDGVMKDAEPITAKPHKTGKSIFFSMPGVMAKEDEIMTKDFKSLLERKGYDVIYYSSDSYPNFGQFNRVRESIMHSSAMVAFGLKQLNIHKASYRPGTKASVQWEGKWLSTPWSEIEVGMGLMKGIPILLVCDPDINNGVFDDGLSECFVSRLYTTTDCRTLEQNKSFEEWLSKI